MLPLPCAPNNTNFTTDKVFQVFWVGERYSVRPDLDLALAYYHQSQNSFVIGNGTNPKGTCKTAVSAGCSGTLDAVSFVTDYRFAKHFDAYAGVMGRRRRMVSPTASFSRHQV